MAEREIIQLGNQVLWEKSREIEDCSARLCQSLVQDLSETLQAFRQRTGYGRGIAAPQINSLHRVIFIRMQPTGFCGALINPRISWASDQSMELWDDCFSFPELMVLVRRSFSVSVDYKDERGLSRSINAEGALSELLQHEIDHLDGVLAIDRAVGPHSLMTRAEWERQRAARPFFEHA